MPFIGVAGKRNARVTPYGTSALPLITKRPQARHSEPFDITESRRLTGLQCGRCCFCPSLRAGITAERSFFRQPRLA